MRKLLIPILAFLLITCIIPTIQSINPDLIEVIYYEIEGACISPSPHPNSFIPNHGQLDHPDVQFYTQGPFRTGFCSDSVIYAIENEGLYSFKVHFEGCNPTTPIGQQEQITKHNYFLGNDSSKWQSNIPLFDEILYPDIYPGINLRYYSNKGNLKYDFIVQPGADPNLIQMKYVGVDGLDLDCDGNLMIHTPLGIVEDSNLIAFQSSQCVQTSFVIDQQTVFFDIGSYDSSKPLVIDPELVFSTYFGIDTIPEDCCYDDNNTLYLTGSAGSTTFPVTPGVYDTTHNGNTDIFVSKLSSNGDKIIQSTFIGGTSGETGYGITLDKNGNIYVLGASGSSGFPVSSGAYDTTHNGGVDAVVFCLNNNLSTLQFSTFLGSTENEIVYGIGLDDSANVYICGETEGSTYPTTTGAYDESYDANKDAFVSCIKNDGTSLLSSTFIGGGERDMAKRVKVDSSGDVIISGTTESSDFPMEGSGNKTVLEGKDDMFICKMNADLDTMDFSTFVGGSGSDANLDLEIDADGNYLLSGYSVSKDIYNTTEGNDTTYNGMIDAIIIRISKDGTKSLSFTYYGGSGDDYPGNIELTESGDVFLIGTTLSDDLPVTADAYHKQYDDWGDGFIVKFSSNLSLRNFSSYWSGNGQQPIYALAVDSYGNLAFAGKVQSTNFPIKNALYSARLSTIMGYISKFRFNPQPPAFKPNITSINTGNSFVNLSWDPPIDNGGSNITHYSIYRSSYPGEKTKLTDTLDNTTWFNDTGVTNGVTYYYNISAVNAIGEGPLSEEVNGLPQWIPSEPLNPATESGPNFVNLTWDAPLDNGGALISSYNIYRGTSSGALSLIQTGVTKLWFNDTGRTNGVTYFYQIGAVNAVGLGFLSAEVNDTPYDRPSAPFFLSATRSDGALNLSWNAPTSNGGDPQITYDVYRGGTNTTMVEVASDLDVLYYNNTGLTNGQLYFFTVRAKNLVGYSPFAEEFNSTPASVPSPPLDLVAEAGDGYVELNWTEPTSDGGDPVSGYRVYRGEATDSKVFISLSDELGFNDTTVDNDKTYFYTVRAVNLLGVSAFSNEVNATPSGTPIVTNTLPEVTLSSPANNSELDILNPTFSWTSVDADGDNVTYDLYLGLIENDVLSLSGITLNGTGLSSTSFNLDYDLFKGETYYWTVIPNDGIGNGICLSGVWTFKVKEDAMANALPKFISTPPKDAGVDKKWSYSPLVTDADGDDITLELDKKPTGMTIASGKLTWTPTSSQVGEHFVIIKASDGKGASFQEFTIMVTTDGPANRAPEVQAISDITINATDSLSVQVVASDPDGDELSYTLTDGPAGAVVSQGGKVIWNPGEAGTFDFEIEVSDGELSASVSFKVTVKSGSDDDIVPDDDVVPDDDDDTGFIGSIAFFALIGAIVLIILIVVGILVFVMIRKRKTPDELETPQEQTPDQPAGPQTTQDEYQDTGTDPFAQLAVQDAQANPVSQDMYGQQDLYGQPQETVVQPPMEEPKVDQPVDSMAEQPMEQLPPEQPAIEQDPTIEPKQDELFDI